MCVLHETFVQSEEYCLYPMSEYEMYWNGEALSCYLVTMVAKDDQISIISVDIHRDSKEKRISSLFVENIIETNGFCCWRRFIPIVWISTERMDGNPLVSSVVRHENLLLLDTNVFVSLASFRSIKRIISFALVAGVWLPSMANNFTFVVGVFKVCPRN